MPIQKINIEEFLTLSKQHPVFDVRSPGEYAQAHIPSAFNIPLFNDEERKQVGTAYKQESREVAIKIGLDYFGVKMRKMVEEVEEICNLKYGNKTTSDIKIQSSVSNSKTLLIHCWRGGMRSAAIAWLLDMYGFNVYLLVGGYKGYRNWVLSQFEKAYPFIIVGGYTGSGKTEVLHQLKKHNKQLIDLEDLANHKGSAFGALEGKPQPRQEMFENLLAKELYNIGLLYLDKDIQYLAPVIYIEDESQRIGNLQIPMPLWYTMRKSPVYFLDIPFDERLDFITAEYGKQDKEELKNAILRIQKRLGGLETKNALQFLEDNQLKDCFSILLSYYDKWYGKALFNRENISSLLIKIPCAGVDSVTNSQKIIACNIVSVS